MPDERRTHADALAGLVAAWQSGDAIRAAAYFSLDGRYAEAGHEPIAGRDALIAHFTRFFRDGPRFRMDVDDVLIDGAKACVSYRFAIEGASNIWRERAGCAVVSFDIDGALSLWREYEG